MAIESYCAHMLHILICFCQLIPHLSNSTAKSLNLHTIIENDRKLPENNMNILELGSMITDIQIEINKDINLFIDELLAYINEFIENIDFNYLLSNELTDNKLIKCIIFDLMKYKFGNKFIAMYNDYMWTYNFLKEQFDYGFFRYDEGTKKHLDFFNNLKYEHSLCIYTMIK
jgi:hypothetical protein